MNEDTWGISGTDFIGIYLIALLGSLLFAFAVRILTRSGADHSTPAPEALPALRLACLTGGPRRVVEAAVAQLVDTGQLRPSRDGYLQATSQAQGADPVEQSVLADVRRHGKRSVNMLVYRLSNCDAVREVAATLVASGLLVDDELARRRKNIGMVPIVLLLVIGVIRWFAGIQNDRPIGWLTALLAGTAVIVFALRKQNTCPRTFRGATMVSAAEAATPAESVAAGGFQRYPDRVIRESLVGSTATRTGAWAFGAGGFTGGYAAGCTSSGGGGGGSSCGGGGGCGG